MKDRALYYKRNLCTTVLYCARGDLTIDVTVPGFQVIARGTRDQESEESEWVLRTLPLLLSMFHSE